MKKIKKFYTFQHVPKRVGTCRIILDNPKKIVRAAQVYKPCGLDFSFINI